MEKFVHSIKNSGLRIRHIDAKDKVVGRLAAHISTVLQGKDKPTFHPSLDNGDVVVVTNAKHLEFTGNKFKQKLYRWHTGFPGGLKEITAQDEFNKNPGSVLYRAVSGMLPKNKLRKARLLKLRIYPDEAHPFKDDSRLMLLEIPKTTSQKKEPYFQLEDGHMPLNILAYKKRFGQHMDSESIKSLDLAHTQTYKIEATDK